MVQRPTPNKKSVDYIIQKAGGEIELSAYLTRKFTRSISQYAMRQWRKRGIPEDYWPDIAKLSGLPIDDIWKANGG